jgi:DNA-binding transcriptional ArsR family regulator
MMTRLDPVIALLELIPSAGRLRVLEAISVAGELGPIDLYRRDAAPSLGMASYHVKELLKAGLIELARTETGGGRRGAVAHFYRLTSLGVDVLARVDAIADAIDGPRVLEATS